MFLVHISSWPSCTAVHLLSVNIPFISGPPLYHWVLVVVVVMVVHTTAQHCVVDGWRWSVRSLCCCPINILLSLTAQNLPEGGAHLLITVGVDDGVHGWVELSEKQEELFKREDVAAGTEHIKKEDDQAGSPADYEGTWGNTKQRKCLSMLQGKF